MGTKVMVDFPAFITRDSETRWLLVGDDSHVLLSNTVISELYRQLINTLGYKKTMRILYRSAWKGTHLVQEEILDAFHSTVKTDEDLTRRIAKIPFYIQTYGHGRGKTIHKGKEFVFQVQHSSIALALKDSNPGAPVCSFLSGFFAGMAEVFAARYRPTKYVCTETKCLASGDPYCEFHLSAKRNK